MFSRWQLADLEIKARYGALAATAAMIVAEDRRCHSSGSISRRSFTQRNCAEDIRIGIAGRNRRSTGRRRRLRHSPRTA